MTSAKALLLASRDIAAAGLVVVAFTMAAFAGDSLPVPAPPPQVEASTPEVQTEVADYLRRRAALLLIRAMFDVMPQDRVGDALRQDYIGLEGDGPSEADQQALDSDLLAEGSYLIVSLRYLVQGGGAVWPPDRTQQAYEDDALKQLIELQVEWSRIVATRSDPLPALQDLDRLYALTEGYGAIPPGFDHFAGRDDLVDEATTPSKARVDL